LSVAADALSGKYSTFVNKSLLNDLKTRDGTEMSRVHICVVQQVTTGVMSSTVVYI
jgi:hypothetical protein